MKYLKIISLILFTFLANSLYGQTKSTFIQNELRKISGAIEGQLAFTAADIFKKDSATIYGWIVLKSSNNNNWKISIQSTNKLFDQLFLTDTSFHLNVNSRLLNDSVNPLYITKKFILGAKQSVLFNFEEFQKIEGSFTQELNPVSKNILSLETYIDNPSFTKCGPSNQPLIKMVAPQLKKR